MATDSVVFSLLFLPLLLLPMMPFFFHSICSHFQEEQQQQQRRQGRIRRSFSHKLFPCSPHFHSQIGGGGPRHAHPLSQLDSTLDPFDELLLPLTSAMWPWLRGCAGSTSLRAFWVEMRLDLPHPRAARTSFPTTPTTGPRWGRLATPESGEGYARSGAVNPFHFNSHLWQS